MRMFSDGKIDTFYCFLHRKKACKFPLLYRMVLIVYSHFLPPQDLYVNIEPKPSKRPVTASPTLATADAPTSTMPSPISLTVSTILS